MSAAAASPSDAAYCANLVREADFERYAATLFVVPEMRRPLLALFAFNVEIARVRAQISQPLAGEIRLQWWSDLLAAPADAAAGNPVAAELINAIERHVLPVEPLNRLIEARRFDLYDDRLRDMSELEAYLDDTASVLFGLAARMLGADVEAGDATLRHAGLAFGLTRILEALPRHSAQGQLYLPLAELERAGIAAEDVLSGRSTPQLQVFLAGIAGEARQHLARALQLLPQVERPARPALLPLALVDRKLQRMTGAASSPFAVRPVSNLAVLWALWRGARRAPFKS